MRPDGGSSQQVQQELQRKYHGMQLLLNGRYKGILHLDLYSNLEHLAFSFIQYHSIRTRAPK